MIIRDQSGFPFTFQDVIEMYCTAVSKRNKYAGILVSGLWGVATPEESIPKESIPKESI